MSCFECKLSSFCEDCEKMTDEEKSPSRTTRTGASSSDFDGLSDTGSTPTPVSYSSGSRGPPSVCDEIKVEQVDEDEYDQREEHELHQDYNLDTTSLTHQQYPS